MAIQITFKEETFVRFERTNIRKHRNNKILLMTIN